MGFKSIRSEVIKKLKEGNIQHELRKQIELKNQLSTGEKTPEDVIKMLTMCRGDQHTTEKHKDIASVDIHIFKPVIDGTKWYVKCYMIEPDVWFISVHD